MKTTVTVFTVSHLWGAVQDCHRNSRVLKAIEVIGNWLQIGILLKRPKNMERLETDKQLTKLFEELCILQYEQVQEMKSKEANETFDKIYKLAVRARSLDDKGAEMLSGLIGHPNDNVKLKAAFLLLPLNSNAGLNALRRLANSKVQWISTNAEISAQEWKAGRLDVDWFLKKK
jgi:Domain of unknown function (DUF2019)